MTSRSLPISVRQAQKRSLSIAAVHAPSLRTAIIVSIAVLILFRWLHLLLALQITATSRQIQIRTDELGKLQRESALLQEEAAAAESPKYLAAEAARLGYGPRTPVYIPVEKLVAEPAVDVLKQGTNALPGMTPPSTSTPEVEGSRSAFSTWLETVP